MKRAILFFDTSRTGAAALMLDTKPLPTLHLLRRMRFNSDEGDETLRELFGAAALLRKEGYHVTVGAEQPQGADPRFQSGRAAANAHIGVIQDYTRRYDLVWGGCFAPATAKASLANNGRASKPAMIQAANRLYGKQIVATYGKLLEYTGDSRTCHEHEADAIGGAQAHLFGRPWIILKTGGRAAKAVANRTAKKAPAQTALW